MAGSGTSRRAQHALRLLGAAADALTFAGGWLGAALVAVILVLTGLGVFTRYVLGAPINGIDEATGFLVVAVVMAGAAEALRRGDHIRIDLVLDRAGPGLRRVLDIVAAAAVLGLALILLVVAWRSMIFSREFGAFTSGYLELPLWMVQAPVPAGAALLALAALARLLRHLAGGASEPSA
jgi:TRAP-type C4-dicarboxylate transport system permease small subunit